MGWTFYHKPTGISAVDSIKREFGADWCEKHVVASTATWEAVFLVVKRHDPESKIYIPDADGTVRELGVIKIKNSPRARDGYNFGYKDMSEAMGPVGCEAPLSILAKCSPLRDLPADPGDTSLLWVHKYRARCAVKAAAKAVKRGLKPGAIVTLAEPLSFGGEMLRTFTVERAKVRGRRAGLSTVFRSTTTGLLCGISAGNLVGATIA
jgi:hypothetical protein